MKSRTGHRDVRDRSDVSTRSLPAYKSRPASASDSEQATPIALEVGIDGGAPVPFSRPSSSGMPVRSTCGRRRAPGRARSATSQAADPGQGRRSRTHGDPSYGPIGGNPTARGADARGAVAVPALAALAAGRRALIAVDDLPLGDLMRAVVGFEQSRTPADVLRVAEALRDWLSARNSELGGAFAALDGADGRPNQPRAGRGGSRRDLGGGDVDFGGTGCAVARTVAQRRRGRRAAGRRRGRTPGGRGGRSPGGLGGTARVAAPGRRDAIRRSGWRTDRKAARRHRRLGAAVGDRGTDRAQGEANLIDGVAEVARRSD